MKPLSLNRNQLKYIAAIAMTIDHIAWAFVPAASLPGQIMHLIGRLTAPIMAYFIVEGYVHTRSVGKYVLRMAIFALISWPAFVLFEYGRLPFSLSGKWLSLYLDFGVIYTLFLSLLAVWLWDKGPCPRAVKLLGIAGLCLLSRWGDWPVYDVLFTLTFFIWRNDKKRLWTAYCFVAAIVVANLWMVYGFAKQLFQVGVFLVIPLLALCYNGEKGSSRPVHKWFFYVFYPAHLLVLTLLKAFLL